MPFSQRSAIVYDIPLPEAVEVLRPEMAILRFEHGGSLDVGALCYTHREQSKKKPGHHRQQNEGRKVNLDSLNHARVEHVRALIAHVSDEMANSGLRAHTVYGNLSRFLVFVGWADENGMHGILHEPHEAKAGIRAYSAYLREQVNTNALSVNSAARMQNSSVAFLGDFLEIEDIARGLNLLQRTKSATESTTPPSEDDQSKVLALCESLFSGICDLALESKPYPHKITMPNYLGWPKSELFIFPSTTWCMPPHIIEKRRELEIPRWGYDYSNGTLTTADDLKKLEYYCRNDDSFLGKIVRETKSQITTANTDLQSNHRRQAAAIAISSFWVMFQAQTGMNTAQMTDLPWTGEFDVDATHQLFRAIKYRASGRVVHFEIPINFMPSFKQYLNLRRYLLNGQPCPYLFVNMAIKAISEPGQYKSHVANNFYRTLRYIDPCLNAIQARQWRAAKSDWLIRNTDPSTAAIILQNSEKTILDSYAAGSETSHLEEMGKFLDGVSSAVVDKDQKIEGGVIRAAGTCSSFGSPRPIAEDSALKPTCKEPEGCLFCDKFKVHADECDTRKLLSCRYCLEQAAPMAGSDERFQSMIKPIIDRIQRLLDEIGQRDASMVAKVVNEVYQDGELDGYWAGKLQMLMDLGVIS